MDFTEAEQRRAGLTRQLARGEITQEAYTASINALRVTDSTGRTWQPAPSPAGWLWWNGTAWQAATPPQYAGQPPGDQPARAKDFNEFRTSLMTVDEFKKVSKDVPLAKRPQKWWDLLSVLGGVTAAVLWFLYGSVRSGREGFDLITPLLMIAIPVFLVWFREDIDQVLLPLQPHRKKVSKIILIGLGMATPFLTAWILYNIFNISQYPLMQANIVVGTLAAYAVTRDPLITGSRKFTPPAGTAAALFLVSAVFASMIIPPVLADDCASDPLNAQDCLRTDGYAEGMAGLVAAILGILVNGPIIAQTLISGGTGVQPPVPSGPPAPPGPQTPPEPPAPPQTPAEPPAPASPAEPPKPTEDDLRAIKEAQEAAREQKEAAAAAAAEAKERAATAAAAAREKAEAAAAALRAQGIDPLTGKRILTPEQMIRKAQILKEMAASEAEAAAWSSYANKLETAVTVLETVEKTADIAIDIGSTLSPGAGAKIKNIYAATKTIGKNVSQSYADGKSLVDGLKDGVVEAATDKALDMFAGKVTDKFKGKIPGFGKFDTHTGDYGNMTMGQIKERLGSSFIKETGDIGQDLRHLIQQSDARRAVGNAAKNAVQGQVQGATLWDPFKKFFGISK